MASNHMRNYRHLAVFALACALSSCATVPKSTPTPKTEVFVEDGKFVRFDPEKDPYWMYPPWTASLFKAVQSVVHDPVDATDMSSPGLHATIKFTYADGVIEYPDIVQSTGNQDLDKLMLRQVASAQPPQATGPHAEEIHEFVMELDMPTPFESFQSGIYGAMDAKKIYPKYAVMSGAGGIVAVDFDYLDGKTSSITLVRSSKNKDLDKASVNAVMAAVMPPAPPAYAGQVRHMEAIFCYSLRESTETKDPCPAGRNVIEVTGTRTRR